MSDDFYPFVDSGDPAPDHAHLTGRPDRPESPEAEQAPGGRATAYACRIAVYDDMLSAPRVIVIAPSDVRTFLEEITNTVYRCMKEQGGSISLQVIREICENFIHADFQEPTISVLDGGNTIRFADQGPGIADKERAFEFGVTSADREQKRYIRGTGSGFPIVQDYLTHMGGAVSIEDNMGAGTVVTVTLDPARVVEIERAHARGAAVRPDYSGWTPAGPNACPAQTQGTADSATWGGGAPAAPPDPWAGGQAAPPQQPMAYPQQMPAGASAQVAMGGMQAQPWASQAPWPQQQAQVGAYGQPWNQGNWPVQQSPAAWRQPQAIPWGGGWPQPMGGGYPTAPGQAGVPAGAPGAQAAGAAYHASERGQAALAYIQQHGSCGPTELTCALGSSNPTWSRELATLARSGLIIKQGQKYVLTDMGSMWLQGQ